jgi:hypothetical protein
VCVLCSPLLLPLAIVSECVGKLTAYLCRVARDQQVVSELYRFTCVAGLIAGDGTWLGDGR